MRTEDVENLLAQSAKFGALNAAGLGSRVPVDPEDLRALCERWLVVEDAAAAEVSYECDTVASAYHVLPAEWDDEKKIDTLLGQRVRLVVVAGNGGEE